MAADRENELPDWMSPAGGRKKWADWIERQAARCRKRARDWYASRKQTATVATKAEWRLAILNAAEACGGRGHFSQLPLSLELPATDARYPSLEHLRGPADCTIAIELRVVNDMKTILRSTRPVVVWRGQAVRRGFRGLFFPSTSSRNNARCRSVTLVPRSSQSSAACCLASLASAATRAPTFPPWEHGASCSRIRCVSQSTEIENVGLPDRFFTGWMMTHVGGADDLRSRLWTRAESILDAGGVDSGRGRSRLWMQAESTLDAGGVDSGRGRSRLWTRSRDGDADSCGGPKGPPTVVGARGFALLLYGVHAVDGVQVQQEPRAVVVGPKAHRQWSGREDLNLRLLGPEPSALPGCATPRIPPRRRGAGCRIRTVPCQPRHD